MESACNRNGERDAGADPGRGCQLDLHGVQLNVTTIIADQNYEQHVGIEHIAIETHDYAGALANFTARRSSKSASTTVGMCAGLPRPMARRWS
jgi:hypothetical protein